MAEPISIQQLKDASLDVKSLEEVVNGDENVVVTTRLGETYPSVKSVLENMTSNLGFILVDSFELGATLIHRNQALRHAEDGKLYRWGGSLPKTVASGSTPQNTGGFAANAWVEVSDATIRSELKDQTGAGFVGIQLDGKYSENTVGHAIARRRVEDGSELLPKLDSDKASGRYYVVSAPDTPFNGTADVNLYTSSAGDLFGTCVLTNTGTDNLQKQAIAKCRRSVWSDFEVQPIVDYGTVATSGKKKFKIAEGGYSWWSEPQSCQLSGIHPKIAVGSVDREWSKLTTVDTSGVAPVIKNNYLKNSADYKPDEHNGAVCRPVKGKLFVAYPGHQDKDYIPYRVSSDMSEDNFGEEKKIMSGRGKVSYSQVLYSSITDTLYVAFRSSGQHGSVNAWYLAESNDWDADAPNWNIIPLFEDTEQMYCRFVMAADENIVRALATKNARYEDINGLWYAYIALNTRLVKTVNGEEVGTLDDDVLLTFDQLGQIYATEGRMRLYDVAVSGNLVGMLISVTTGSEHAGTDYKYLEYSVHSWTMLKESVIAHTGRSLSTNWYYGGAHFSNVLFGNAHPMYRPIYVSREQDGTWYIEEYESYDGLTWSVSQVIDKSDTEKLWRPRVPFETRSTPDYPNKIKLTWCKGAWGGFRNYIADIWALTN